MASWAVSADSSAAAPHAAWVGAWLAGGGGSLPSAVQGSRGVLGWSLLALGVLKSPR